MSTAKKGYSKRNSQAASLLSDTESDPDFKAGAYVPTPAPKRKAKAAIEKAVSKKRKADSGNTSTTLQKVGGNPLLKYFGELDLQSASEDEDDEDPFDDFEVLDSASEGRNRTSTSQVASSSKSGSAPEPIPVVDDDETEDESEVDVQPQAPIMPPPKPVIVDDDETEDESDEDWMSRPFPKPVASSIKPSFYASDAESDTEPKGKPRVARPAILSPKPTPLVDESVTEDDSEPNLVNLQYAKARPGFPLGKDQQLQKALVLDKEQGIMIPAAINTYLREYQRDGVRFLWRQYNSCHGGLLGDDMGLGKTVQVISFLSAIMKKRGDKSDLNRRRNHVSKLQDGKEWRTKRKLPPANATWATCLIIAPSTVVHNWERELQTWGYFEVGIYTGTPKEREPVLRDFKLGRLDVVLTTFDVARMDIELLDDLAWSCIFVDEVHTVKNETSKKTQAYHQFQCLRRFGLTGTTIQNSYKEMWAILHWTNPGAVGTAKQWNGYVSKPLTWGQSTRATEEQRVKGLLVAQILRDDLLPNFFLRRTKEIIKDQLPKKLDQVVFCPLTKVQIAAYKHILETEAVTNLLSSREKCDCGSQKQRKNCCHRPVAGDVFRFMSALIKLSNHLALILPGPNDTPEQTLRNRELAEIAFPDGHIPKFGTAMMQAKYCGKWTTLEVLLKQWRTDRTNKVLIFTKSVKLLDMLEFHLSSRPYRFLKLDGSTKQQDRMPMIDEFNNDPEVFIFLISTLAGGTGLNLTGANKVVIFDPNWNPAHDLQAMDRAFRFGQTRDVDVFRLLGAGSIEELIYARQIYKQQQMAIGYDASVQTRYFEGVQGDNQNRGELFGVENIFKLHEDQLATKMAIEKAALAELDWALANSEGRKKTDKNNVASDLLEAGQKLEKEHRGLAALLFDDTTPTPKKAKQDGIQQTLRNIGVKYSHVNDEILLPSRIEAERTRGALMTKLKKAGKSKNTKAPAAKKEKEKKGKKETEVPVQWPLRRNLKKAALPPPPPPKVTNEDRLTKKLMSRRQALIALDFVKNPQDVPQFALQFARETKEAQQDMLQRLDDFIENQGLEQYSDASSD
ncbi:P-loop containing nucleoside triphosphate hydrolase protein [Panaeolus papilionaceus]|nr:P-loop containing nucleoside triphosphate hydrolase protein [Panaeolus papilionaceus]